jgi:hypothetical protein
MKNKSSKLTNAQICKVNNQLILDWNGETQCISFERLFDGHLLAIFKDEIKNDVFEGIAASWVLDKFVCPEYIITPELFSRILNNEISNPKEITRQFMQRVKLTEHINEQELMQYVLTNPEIDKPIQLAYACDLIKGCDYDYKILKNIHEFVEKCMYDRDFSKRFFNYYHSKYKMDLTKTDSEIEKTWYQLKPIYDGQLKLSESTILLDSYSDLPDDIWSEAGGKDMCWEEMLHHRLFLLKTTNHASGELLIPIYYDLDDDDNPAFLISEHMPFLYANTEAYHAVIQNIKDEVFKTGNLEFFNQNYWFDINYALVEQIETELMLSKL